MTFAGKAPATEPVVSFGLANMWFYALKRTGLAVVIVAVAVLLLFSLLHMIPGDPISIALGPRATPEIIERYTKEAGVRNLEREIAAYRQRLAAPLEAS